MILGIMENEIYLDLKFQRLFGWEKTKKGILIASILEGILESDEFPSVPILALKENKDKFYLDPKRRFNHIKIGDGGHKRALGHLIAEKPLKCRVTYVEKVPLEVNFPIQNITILHHQDDLKYFKWLREEIGFYREVSKDAYRNFRRRFPNGKKVSYRIK